MPSTTNSSSARRGALERLGAVAAGDDELGDQRVERAGDGLRLVAAVETDAGAARRSTTGQRAGRGHEVPAAVLAVDPELDRVALERRVVVPELLAVGDAEHLADEVEAGDLLRDAGARPAGGCSPRGTRSCRPRRSGTRTCPLRRSRLRAGSPSMPRTASCSARR